MGADRVRTMLSPQQCLHLLTQAKLGRMVLSVNCLPTAIPLRITVVGDEILALADDHDVYQAAIRRDIVAVEVDNAAFAEEEWWTVLATGPLHLVGDDENAARLASRATFANAFEIMAPLVSMPVTHITGSSWIVVDGDSE